MDVGINSAGAANAPTLSAPSVSAVRFSLPLVFKRSLDILIAGLACIFLSPLLISVILILLALQGRPLFIAHRRVGRHGKGFSCLKFRTMVVDADAALARHLEHCPQAREEWARSRKLFNDPRITRIGAALRASSVDELPQLINILRGEMSLVGPRPVVDEELAFYGVHVQKYLKVRPGLTGAWQVSGRSNVNFADRVKLDVEYVDTRHFMKDIWILLRTIPAVLLSKGAA